MDKEEKKSQWDFNEGRLSCDNKWLDAIKNRIKELEEEAGIPELRRLLKKVKYGWAEEHASEKVEGAK